MRSHWRMLFASAMLTLLFGTIFVGHIVLAGYVFMAYDGWWRLLSLIIFAAGCCNIPGCLCFFEHFRDDMQEPVRLLRWRYQLFRWRCQRLQAALHEPPPEE